MRLRPFHRFAYAAALCLASAVAVFSVRASLVIPRTIADAVETAEVVFAGHVTRIHAEHAGRHNAIVTHVDFDRLEQVKGDLPGSTVTLRLRGGRIGTEMLGVEGQPEFAVGGRYAVFCTTRDFGSDENGFNPTLGMNEGVFRLETPEGLQGDIVLDPSGRLVVGTEGDRLVVLGPSRPDTSGSPVRVISHDRTTRVDPEERARASQPRPIGPKPEPPRGRALPVASGPEPPRHARASPDSAAAAPARESATKMPTEPTVIVVDPSRDTGARLSPREFLATLRSMTR